MSDGALEAPRAVAQEEPRHVAMQVDLELTVDGDISQQELAALLMDAVDDTEGIALEFACTAIQHD